MKCSPARRGVVGKVPALSVTLANEQPFNSKLGRKKKKKKKKDVDGFEWTGLEIIVANEALKSPPPVIYKVFFFFFSSFPS